MFKKTLLLFLLMFLNISYAIAYSDYIIASGENIGIEIKSDGVIVVGTYKIDGTVSNTEIRIGDIIKSINDNPISTISEMISSIDIINQDTIKLGYVRGNIEKYTNFTLKKVNNTYKTGLYVKDSVTGVGTLTYIDPNTKIFGALGHEIVEKNTGKLLITSNGTIFDSEVISVTKSSNGVPGEKNAKYYSSRINGTIFENTSKGVFGTYQKEIKSNKLYKVASPGEVKKGEANILTVLKGTEVKSYNINITKISKLGSTKNIVFEITDPELLNSAGGIVQGMSGSPIIQNDMIVGAITHVIVDNPLKGYGIFITNMLEEAEN